MKKGLIAGGVLVLAGIGGYTLWVKFGPKALQSAEDNFNAADELFGKYVPYLPIHSKSVSPTRGEFSPNVSTKYKDGITTARDTDWLNPTQLVASTGPGNLAPYATGDHPTKLNKEDLQ